MLCKNMFTERSKVVEKHVQNVTINFGPQHPAAHGVLRLVLTLDGEVGKTIFIAQQSYHIVCSYFCVISSQWWDVTKYIYCVTLLK